MKMKNLFVFAGLVLFASILFTAVFFGDIGPRQFIKYAVVIALLIGGAGLLAALLVSLVASRESANSVLINLTLLVVTSTLLLVVSEFGFRYIYKDVTTTGDSQSYFEKKWQKKVRLNRFGFRERDFDLDKAADVYRIAVIGDSLTFGKGIEEGDRFSNLLEQRLNADKSRRDTNYEVLNFGRPGANTLDEIGFLTEAVLPARPDFIVLQWYKNDVIDSPAKQAMNTKEGRHEEGRHDSSSVGQKFGKAYERMVNNSILFSLLDKQLNRLKQAAAPKAAAPESGTRLTHFDDKSMWEFFGDPNSTGSVRARNALLGFIETARKKSIPVGMVLFTDSYFRPSSELDYLLERVLDECDHEKLTCVDMRQPLEPYKGEMKLWASKLDPHPSAFANRITADEMFAAFGPVWLGRD